MKQNIIITLCVVATFAFLTACPAPETNTNTNTTNVNTPANANTETMNTNGDKMNTNGEKTEGTEGENPMVGGAAMSKDKTVVENASEAKNLTTLVSAVKAADLVETLQGAGPFTVFAPTNEAFDKVKDAAANLMKPENKDDLKKVLTYHVVSGKMDAAAIAEAIKKGDGKATLKTVQGEDLTATMDGDKVIITDAKGGKATVTTANVYQKNGVVHVIDSVLMPK